MCLDLGCAWPLRDCACRYLGIQRQRFDVYPEQSDVSGWREHRCKLGILQVFNDFPICRKFHLFIRQLRDLFQLSEQSAERDISAWFSVTHALDQLLLNALHMRHAEVLNGLSNRVVRDFVHGSFPFNVTGSGRT